MDVRLADHVAWREIDGETFVIDLKNRTMYGLNASGGRAWRGLEHGQPVTAIVHELLPPGSSECSAGVSQAVESFFGELQQLGLVTSEDALRPGQESAPVNGFVPPQVVWHEELRSFGFSCALQAGQSPACTAGPTT
jgi:hypothetical protein